MWKNLLPLGSRTIEIYSGLGLIIAGIISLNSKFDSHISVGQSPLVLTNWLIILGLLQVYANYKYPILDYLRLLLTWVNGTVWLWISCIALLTGHAYMDTAASLALGLGNLYGFIIHFTYLGILWKR